MHTARKIEEYILSAAVLYAYWRKVTDEDPKKQKLIVDFATGAMGASANIVARILGYTEKMT